METLWYPHLDTLHAHLSATWPHPVGHLTTFQKPTTSKLNLAHRVKIEKTCFSLQKKKKKKLFLPKNKYKMRNFI